jgi:hypothetical protein
MNYAAILEALGQASLFQLYRLSAAINNQLDDPVRIAAVKRALRVGQTVRWFDSTENRLVEARLLQINRTRAEVQNLVDGKHWTIQFYLIDLDGQDVAIPPQQRRVLDRNSLRVGDRVGFRDRQGRERFGQVAKLNQKSASVRVDAMVWRVSYGLLMPVIDGALSDILPALPGQWSQVADDDTPDSTSLPSREQTRFDFDDGGDDERA